MGTLAASGRRDKPVGGIEWGSVTDMRKLDGSEVSSVCRSVAFLHV